MNDTNKKANKQNKFVQKVVFISLALMLLIVLFTVREVIIWPEKTLGRIEKHIERQNYDYAMKLIAQYEKRFETVSLQEFKDECNYSLALDALENSNTADARYRLKELPDYPDAVNLIRECDYIDACTLLENGDYSAAFTAFSALSGYKDTDKKLLQCRYATASKTYEAGNIVLALDIFLALGNYEDAASCADAIAIEITGETNITEAYKMIAGMNAKQMQKYVQLKDARLALPSNVLAVGAHHTVGLQPTGAVVAVGSNDYTQCDVQSWNNIIAVDAGAQHTLGLTSDGKVVATGSNEYAQCDVATWSNVVQISAGAYDSYALCDDGTVLHTGFHANVALESLTNASRIAAGSYAFACINNNDTIFSIYPSLNIAGTKDFIDIDVSTGYIVAISIDGTVTASFDGLPQWEDIIAISASSTAIWGIRYDGSIVAYFFRSSDAISIEDIHDIVAVSAGGTHYAILSKDGSVLAFGQNEEGQCNTSSWRLMPIS